MTCLNPQKWYRFDSTLAFIDMNLELDKHRINFSSTKNADIISYTLLTYTRFRWSENSHCWMKKKAFGWCLLFICPLVKKCWYWWQIPERSRSARRVMHGKAIYIETARWYFSDKLWVMRIGTTGANLLLWTTVVMLQLLTPGLYWSSKVPS